MCYTFIGTVVKLKFFCICFTCSQHLKNGNEAASNPRFESPESGIEILTTPVAAYEAEEPKKREG
jgi:hypothetical protein